MSMFFAKICLNLLGYKIDNYTINNIIDGPPKIIIFPHTSKFETIIVCLFGIVTNDMIKFACSDTFMDVYILGNILEYFGAFKVIERRNINNDNIRNILKWVSKPKIQSNESTVLQIKKYLDKYPRNSFAISPEGRLKYSEKWHRGFYEIAKITGYPIVIGGIDFINHNIKINPELIYVDDPKFKPTIKGINSKYNLNSMDNDNIYKNVLFYTQAKFQFSKLYPRHPEKVYPYIILPKFNTQQPTYIDNILFYLYFMLFIFLYNNDNLNIPIIIILLLISRYYYILY
jgi:1-acyl-sn-glycerol-3-phosphate acyltransferase